MKTIWKYELKIEDEQILSIPKYSYPLAVMTQRDILCIWFLVNPKLEKEDIKIYIYGTGHELPDTAYASNESGCNQHYIGSAKMLNDNLVWHIFWDKYYASGVDKT
jgi:hypothetical protein